MFNLLISLLIRLFFRRPAGIAPGQKAGGITEAQERLEEAYCVAHDKRYRRRAPSAPKPVFEANNDLNFSL